MSGQSVFNLLVKTGVILDGHFLLTSGKHSSRFLLLSQLMQYPEAAGEIGCMVAEPFASGSIQTVVGPAMGGVILAYEAARYLGARAIFAEPSEGRMVFKRGFKVKAGEKVLVVEDAVTTGGSVKKVLDLLLSLRAEPVAVSVIVDRSAGRVDFGLPTRSLLTMDIPSYDPSDCPLCRDGIPLELPKA
jgi:orotate phosphoribosyltransferase